MTLLGCNPTEARFEIPSSGQDLICRVVDLPATTFLLPEMKLEFQDGSREKWPVPAASPICSHGLKSLN